MGMMIHYFPECKDSRPCFAKMSERFVRKCSVLTSTYEGNICPFCKEERDVTDGYRYFKNGGKIAVEKP